MQLLLDEISFTSDSHSRKRRGARMRLLALTHFLRPGSSLPLLQGQLKLLGCIFCEEREHLLGQCCTVHCSVDFIVSDQDLAMIQGISAQVQQVPGTTNATVFQHMDRRMKRADQGTLACIHDLPQVRLVMHKYQVEEMSCQVRQHTSIGSFPAGVEAPRKS